MKIDNQTSNKNKQIEFAAEQWVNLVFAHLNYKKQNQAKENKNNYGK